jgi:hypothetical protein
MTKTPLANLIDIDGIYRDALAVINDDTLTMAENYHENDLWASRGTQNSFLKDTALASFGRDADPHQIHMFKDGSFFFDNCFLTHLGNLPARKMLLLSMLDMLEEMRCAEHRDGCKIHDLVKTIGYVSNWTPGCKNLVKNIAQHIRRDKATEDFMGRVCELSAVC